MAAKFLKKTESFVVLLVVLLLCALPFVQLLFEKIFGIPLADIDIAMVNLVFLFACFACMVTWRNDKHICIAAVEQFAPQKVQTIVNIIKSLVVPCVLVALFMAAFSELFIYYYPEDKIWGIPLRFIFVFLPISYLVMIITALAKKENRIFSIIGVVFGLLISTGPLAGIIYSLVTEWGLTTNLDGMFNFLYPIFDTWIAFSANTTAVLIILFVILAFLGVPLFLVISAITYIAFSQGGGYVEQLSVEAYTILTDKSIAAIPLFTIAGFILSRGSAGKRLVDIFSSLFGWFKGGVIVASVLVAAFFTTITGVSGATILALGTLLTTVLTGVGNEKDKSESLITSSGALGLLFPPSLAIIMYGTTNYFSVDTFELFKGAVVPGIMLAIAMIIMGIIQNKGAKTISFSGQRLIDSLKNGFFEILLPVFIVGGYFGGLFTLFQAAAFAVLYSFSVTVWIRKDFSFKGGLSVIIESLPTTGGILAIFGAARGLSFFFLDANIPEVLSNFVISYVDSKIVFLLLLNVVLLVVGCLMDIYSAILIVSPLLIPIAESFGIHAVHMGVIFLMNMQLGFLTPPVGMDLFISSYAFDKPVMRVVKGILPFLLVELIVLLLVTYIPWFTTFLL